MLKTVIAVIALLSFSVPAFTTPVDDMNTAISLMQRKNIDQAKEILLRVITAQGMEDEKRAFAYLLLSMCVEGTPEALTYSAKAVELAPRNSTAYERYAGELYKSKRYEEAIAGATKALEITPVNANALGTRGMAYRESGNLEKAIGDFTAAINLNADAGLNYARRGKSYYMKGVMNSQKENKEDFDNASSDLRKATESNIPGGLSGECFYYMAKIEHARKNGDSAEKYFKRAVSQLKNKEKLEDANSMIKQIERIRAQTESNNIWR
jgi:tetratricopeptide (TPR) repeat protein